MSEGPAGVRLELADGRPAVTGAAAINDVLHPIGFRLWPLDLAGAGPSVRSLLADPEVDDAGAEELRQQFLLPRDRLLALIAEAGRTPQVPGGGELSTFDTANAVRYPQLFVIEPGADYTRFDRFHVNRAEDGSGLDEVMQVLCGGGIRVLQHLPDGTAFTVTVDCVVGGGWIVTYDGGRPHIGSFTGATPGTKVLVQAIGPARWSAEYVDT